MGVLLSLFLKAIDHSPKPRKTPFPITPIPPINRRITDTSATPTVKVETQRMTPGTADLQVRTGYEGCVVRTWRSAVPGVASNRLKSNRRYWRDDGNICATFVIRYEGIR